MCLLAPSLRGLPAIHRFDAVPPCKGAFLTEALRGAQKQFDTEQLSVIYTQLCFYSHLLRYESKN